MARNRRPADEHDLSHEAEPLVEAPDLLTRAYGHPAPPQRRLPAALLNAALVLTIVCIAGLTPVAARDAVAALPPLSAGFVRFALAGLLLLGTYALRGEQRRATPPRPIERGDYGRYLLAALLCVPANQFCFLMGVKLANASHAGLFYALNPVIVYVLTLLIGRARWSLRMNVATMLAFGGAAVIGWDGLQGQAAQFFLGDVLLFGAVATWAGYSVVAAPLAEKYGALRSVTIVMLVGAVMYAPVIFVDGHRLDWSGLTWRAVGGFAFITVITSYLNYTLWFVALTRMDINRLSVAVNGAPLVAVLAAAAWHDEPITRWLVVGGLIILSAITLANWDKYRAWRAARTKPGR